MEEEKTVVVRRLFDFRSYAFACMVLLSACAPERTTIGETMGSLAVGDTSAATVFEIPSLSVIAKIEPTIDPTYASVQPAFFNHSSLTVAVTQQRGGKVETRLERFELPSLRSVTVGTLPGSGRFVRFDEDRSIFLRIGEKGARLINRSGQTISQNNELRFWDATVVDSDHILAATDSGVFVFDAQFRPLEHPSVPGAILVASADNVSYVLSRDQRGKESVYRYDFLKNQVAITISGLVDVTGIVSIGKRLYISQGNCDEMRPSIRLTEAGTTLSTIQVPFSGTITIGSGSDFLFVVGQPCVSLLNFNTRGRLFVYSLDGTMLNSSKTPLYEPSQFMFEQNQKA